jgi:O-acetyl-ADP-ribose deacetylase (regulator of RNase III)
MSEQMNIILVATHQSLADAWNRFCGNINGVSVYRGSILDLVCDAVVSPANSFGFMDGGIDMAYSRHFGFGVQTRLQTAIKERHHGELLVGMAEIVPTDNSRIPFLIAAPTMRVPMILTDTVNPYLAARAVFLLVKYGTFADGPMKGEPISSVVKTIALPGLGTGVGRVPPHICAQQVKAAIGAVVLNGLFPSTWSEAQSNHQRLYSEHARDLQF